MNVLVSYAQNREDIILDAFLASTDTGFYVDIGAEHPENNSVTKLFYDKGWTGINVTMNTSHYLLFETLRPNDSTIKLQTKKAPNLAVHIANLEFDTLISGKTIDFLRVNSTEDLHGVLRSINLKQNRPRIICITNDVLDEGPNKILSAEKYIYAHNDGLNDYYVADDEKNMITHFKDEYIKRAVNHHIVKPEVNTLLTKNVGRDEQLLKKIATQTAIIVRQKTQIQDMHDALTANPGLLNTLKSVDDALIKYLEKKETQLRKLSNSRQYAHNKVAYKDTQKGVLADVMYYDYSTFQLKVQVHPLWFVVYISYKSVLFVVLGLRTKTRQAVRALRKSLR